MLRDSVGHVIYSARKAIARSHSRQFDHLRNVRSTAVARRLVAQVTWSFGTHSLRLRAGCADTLHVREDWRMRDNNTHTYAHPLGDFVGFAVAAGRRVAWCPSYPRGLFRAFPQSRATATHVRARAHVLRVITACARVCARSLYVNACGSRQVPAELNGLARGRRWRTRRVRLTCWRARACPA